MEKFHVSATEVEDWQQQLGIALPLDPGTGQRLYTQHHINLFKNIKKHLTLGRRFDDIKALVTVPDEPISPMVPTPSPTSLATIASGQKSAAVSTPESIKLHSLSRYGQGATGLGTEEASTLTTLLERTLSEKDELQTRLMETEKLNSHLYNANNLYHRKVRQLSDQVGSADVQEQRQFKLMDDKAKLQAQVLEAEKNCVELRQQLQQLENAHQRSNEDAHAKIENLQRQVKYLQSELYPGGATNPDAPTMSSRIPGEVFCGDWTEHATLMEVRFDHYGIELDPSRQRPFRMSAEPADRMGNLAKVVTTYAYQNNASWQRVETLLLTPSGPDVLEGVLDMTFVMDGKAMANALYKVHSQRVTAASND